MTLSNINQDILSQTVHDLRNVLSGIIGVNNIIEQDIDKPENKEEIKELIKVSNQSSSSLLEFLNEILGSLTPGGDNQKKIFKVSNVIEKAIMLNASNIREANVKIIRKFDDNLYLNSAPIRLLKILINLIDNAIKYSSNNSTITIHGIRQDDGVCIAIEDQGQGMKQEQIDKILGNQDFVKNESSCNNFDKKISSFGVGFFAIKNLIEELGAELQIDSNVGFGTKVSVIFKMNQSS